MHQRNTIQKRENEQTFTGTIPGLVPSDGDDWALDTFRSEGAAANVGGKRVNLDDLVASRVLQTSDAVSGNIENPREGHVPVCMTTGRIEPTGEASGDSLGTDLWLGVRGMSGSMLRGIVLGEA